MARLKSRCSCFGGCLSDHSPISMSGKQEEMEKYEAILSGTTIFAIKTRDLVAVVCDGLSTTNSVPRRVCDYNAVKVSWIVEEVYLAIAGNVNEGLDVADSVRVACQLKHLKSVEKIAHMVRREADKVARNSEFILLGKVEARPRLELYEIFKLRGSYQINSTTIAACGKGLKSIMDTVQDYLGDDKTQVDHWPKDELVDFLHNGVYLATEPEENFSGGRFTLVTVDRSGAHAFATSSPKDPSVEHRRRMYGPWVYDGFIPRGFVQQ